MPKDILLSECRNLKEDFLTFTEQEIEVEAYITPAASRVGFPLFMTLACHVARDVMHR